VPVTPQTTTASHWTSGRRLAYHNYAEMTAEVNQVVANFPAIAQKI